MLISLNWLGKYVDLGGVETDELIRLVGARLVEVEGVIDQRAKYNNIYVVKVVSAEKIPDTKLTLCKIDDGGVVEKISRDEEGRIQVMCGAPNVRAGMLAVWIAPGAAVPASVHEDAPFVIGIRRMLGKYESHGMLAGADELDFGDEHKTIAEISPDEAGVGTPFGELWGLNDIVLEIENKSLTHRPDCFGVVGFAREVAGILGQEFKTPEWLLVDGLADFAHFEFFSAVRTQRMLNTSRLRSSKENPNCTEACKSDEACKTNDLLKVRISDEGICPRYTALVMEKHGDDKPKYLGEMETLLARSGMRPISPLVDVTNYLMLLAGQPLHAFDYDKLVKVGGKAKPEIVVRLARKGETLELLDGRVAELMPSDIVITSSGVPVALAGAMGGKNTEIDENTRKIIVESATFSLYNLRKTQMVHGIFSEAITRFTKGQPAGQTLPVVKEFAGMVAGGMRVLGLIDEFPGGEKVRVVEVGLEQINGLLGTEYTVEQVKGTLECVGFEVSVGDSLGSGADGLEKLAGGLSEHTLRALPSSRGAGAGVRLEVDDRRSSLPRVPLDQQPTFLLRCSVPYWRTDICIPEDIIEEVGRLLGYDNILPVVPRHGTAVRNELFGLKTRVRRILAGAGANEVLSYSFVHGDLLGRVGQDVGNSYKIVNSISPDLQYVRQRLTPSLLVKLAENLKDGYGEFGLFEMNQVFLRDDGMDDEGVPVLNNNLAFAYAARDRKSCFYQAKKYLLYLAERLGVEVKLVQVLGDGLPRCEAFYEPKRAARVMVGDVQIGVIGEVKRSVAAELKLPDGTAAFELGLDAILGKVDGLRKDFRTSQYPAVERDLTLAVKAGVAYEKVLGQIEKQLADKKLVYSVVPTTIYRGGEDEDVKMSFHLEFASLTKTLENKEIAGIMTKLEKLGQN